MVIVGPLAALVDADTAGRHAVAYVHANAKFINAVAYVRHGWVVAHGGGAGATDWAGVRQQPGVDGCDVIKFSLLTEPIHAYPQPDAMPPR